MYIEDNRGLIKRMFGDYKSFNSNQIDSKNNFKTFDGNLISEDLKNRKSRSVLNNHEFDDEKIDSCQSSIEIITPYWASNSGGKIRAIVNTQHLQQAIQQEVCQ